MGLNLIRFHTIRLDGLDYLEPWQVATNAGSPWRNRRTASKAPATNSEISMSAMVILYILCSVLAVGLAYACVAWSNYG